MSQLKRFSVFLAFVLAVIVGPVSNASAEPQRLALVLGQGAYEGGQLPTAANDAGLVAQALTSAGFEVIQGRDLSATDLRRVVRDFLDKAQALEPGSAAVVYLSGHGVQLEGENYLLPVDARIRRDVDVPIEGFRLSDLVRSLEQTPAQVRVVVADMARDYPLASTGAPIAKGLALMEAPAGFVIAFSSAPNITAADGQGPYGAYASALVEMIRQPGLPLEDVFSRVRLRTHEATNGLQTPWHAANLADKSFVFFEQAEEVAVAPVREVRRIEEVPAEEAYAIAVERDTIQDYQAFLRTYPNHRLSRRVSALLAARREAVVWRSTVARNTSEAYWTYLRRYPNGPHAEDSRRRLARLAAPLSPPSVFEEVVYEDLPPPLPVVETIEVVEVVTIIREAPPPPPPPVYLLPQRDYDDEVVTIFREPPPPPLMPGILPIPRPLPIPVRARRPAYFYQPIAPVTPRGAVAIPVAAPVFGGLMGGERNPQPTRGPRPQPPALRGQPGLAAPIEPIRDRAAVRGPRVTPAESEPRTVRLPARPIPLPGQQPSSVRPAPADAGAKTPAVRQGPSRDDLQAARPDREPSRSPRPERDAPVRGPRISPDASAQPPAVTRLPGISRPDTDNRVRPGPRPSTGEDQGPVRLPSFRREPSERPFRAAPVPAETRAPDRPKRPDNAERPLRPQREERPEVGVRFGPRLERQPERREERPVLRDERIRPGPRVVPLERPAPSAAQPRPMPRMEEPRRIERPDRPSPSPAAEKPRGMRPQNCVPTPGRPPCPR